MEDQTSPAGACRETASSDDRFALPGDFPLADFFPVNAQACAAE